jgi:hypothetical protein
VLKGFVRLAMSLLRQEDIVVSYGISQISVGTGLDIEELDRKMYAMKQSRKKSRKLQPT